MRNDTLLTVVTACRGNYEDVIALLEGVRGLSTRQPDIIVFDDLPAVPTPGAPRLFAGASWVRSREYWGKGAAFNAAATFARGEYLLFVEPGLCPERAWDTSLAPFLAPDAVIICRLREAGEEHATDAPTPHPPLVVNRRGFFQVGGFDQAHPSEEVDVASFMARCVDAGMNVVEPPNHAGLRWRLLPRNQRWSERMNEVAVPG